MAAQSHWTSDRKRGAIVGLALGALITAPAVVLAVLSGGIGHGHYGFARLFFPYSMLLTLVMGNTITPPLIGLALVQFPTYGLVIGGGGGERRDRAFIAGVILASHAAAAVLCFSGLIPNFS